MKYVMFPIMVETNVVKVYVSEDFHQAYVFPPFGKYYGLHSDGNVLDFATNFILYRRPENVITFQAYLNSGEDTAVIHIDKIAA